MKKESLFGCIVPTAFFLLSWLVVSIPATAGQELQPDAAPGLQIHAEGKADDKGITFQWSVEERGDRIRNVSVVVRKDGAILRSAVTPAYRNLLRDSLRRRAV